MKSTSVFALACAILLASPLVGATDRASRERLAVTLIDISDLGTQVTWSVGTMAVAYLVYRGPDNENLELLAETSSNFFFDDDPPTGDVHYLILSVDPYGSDIGRARGACVNHRGATGISIALVHCIPTPNAF